MPCEPGPSHAGAALVLDDSPLQVLQLSRLLAACGLSARSACSIERARALIEDEPPLLLLVELWCAAGNGFELGTRLMREYGIPALLLTASGRSTDCAWAARLGFAGVLACPPSLAALRRACAAAGVRGQAGGEVET